MGYLVSKKPVESVGAIASGGASVTDFVTSTSLDLSGESGNCRVFADSSGGALSITLPSGVAGQQVEVIDAGESAGSNVITIVGTIDGATNATIEANGGSYIVAYSGSAWESAGGMNQFFKRDAITGKISTKQPDLLEANALSAGDSGQTYSGQPSNFTNAGINVDQDAGGWGNTQSMTNLFASLTLSVTTGTDAPGGSFNCWNLNTQDTATVESHFVNSVTPPSSASSAFTLNALDQNLIQFIVDLGQERSIDEVFKPFLNSGIAYGIYGRNDFTGTSDRSLTGWTLIQTMSQSSATTYTTSGTFRYLAFYATTSLANYQTDIEIRSNVHASTLNTFQRTFTGAFTLDPSSATAIDADDSPIQDAEMNIEYAIDGGAFSAPMNITAFQALSSIAVTSQISFRYTMVGSAKLKLFTVATVASYLSMSNNGMDMIVQGQSVASIDSNGDLVTNSGRLGNAGTTVQGLPTNFTNAGANVDQDAGGWGNAKVSGATDETDSLLTSAFTYPNTNGSYNAFDGDSGTNDIVTNGSSAGNNDTVHEIDFGSGKEITEWITISSSGNATHTDGDLSWSDDGLSWTVIDSFTSHAGPNVVDTKTFTNNVGAKRYWRTRFYSFASTNIAEVRLRGVSPASTNNTFERTVSGAGTLIPSGATAIDADDSAIQDAEMNIEYAIDGGAFSAPQNITAFRAEANIVYTTSVAFRFTMVGSAKLKSFSISSPNSVLEVTSTGDVRLLDNAIPVALNFPQGAIFGSYTTTERDNISSPVAGQTIFNSTTSKLNFYNGSAWEAITSA